MGVQVPLSAPQFFKDIRATRRVARFVSLAVFAGHLASTAALVVSLAEVSFDFAHGLVQVVGRDDIVAVEHGPAAVAGN
ncbi:MAG TPA: hypothetical protein VN442_25850, partial [Bryobacteraceae bacterium]|nr:hypothetical protein [Bryobacteraceae bacterium]